MVCGITGEPNGQWHMIVEAATYKSQVIWPMQDACGDGGCWLVGPNGYLHWNRVFNLSGRHFAWLDEGV